MAEPLSWCSFPVLASLSCIVLYWLYQKVVISRSFKGLKFMRFFVCLWEVKPVRRAALGQNAEDADGSVAAAVVAVAVTFWSVFCQQQRGWLRVGVWLSPPAGARPRQRSSHAHQLSCLLRSPSLRLVRLGWTVICHFLDSSASRHLRGWWTFPLWVGRSIYACRSKK